MYFDPIVKAGQPIQQNCTRAKIGRQFDAVDSASKRRSEHPGGTGQPCANVEHAIFAANPRKFRQFQRSAQSACVEMVERRQGSRAKGVAPDSIPPRERASNIRASISRAE